MRMRITRRHFLSAADSLAASAAIPALPVSSVSAAKLREALEIQAALDECCCWWDRAEMHAPLNVVHPGWRGLLAALHGCSDK